MSKETKFSVGISRREFLTQSLSGAALFTLSAKDVFNRVNSIEEIAKAAGEQGADPIAEGAIRREKIGIAVDTTGMALGAGRVGKTLASLDAENKILRIVKEIKRPPQSSSASNGSSKDI